MTINSLSTIFRGKSLHLVILCFWSLAISAQDTLSFNLTTPRQAVITHLKNLQPDTYHPEVAAKVFNQEIISPERAQKLAIKLKQILDGAGIYVDIEEIPNQADYVDSTVNKARYRLTPQHPEIFLVKNESRWQYAQSSHQAIDGIHETMYPFGANFFLNLFPGKGQTKFLGLQVRHYLGLLALLLLSWLIYRVSLWLFNKLLVYTAHRLGYRDVLRNFVKPVAKPISMVVVFFFLLGTLPMLQLPIAFSRYLVVGVKIALPIFGVLVFYYLVDVISLYLQKLAAQTQGTMDDQLIPIVRRSMKLIIIGLGALFVLHNLDVNITALLAGLSIGGLALALAAQESLKNFFGSFMIFVDRPFQIGDWISGDGIDGMVEEVGFRSTRIRTFRNSLMTIPNGRLADLTIDNHGLRTYRRFNTHISVTYDTRPDVIETFVNGLKQLVKDHPKTRKDYIEIHLNEMGSASLNILFYIFFEVPTWSEELRSRHEILLSVLRLAEKLQVRFAFPTQTLHMETFPGQPPLTPEPMEDMDALRSRLDNFFKEQQSN